MSKLNPKPVSVVYSEETLPGGARAAKISPIQQLKRTVSAFLLWENLAYIDGESAANQIAELIKECPAAEVASLAIECRTKHKLRHTPLFMIVEMCKDPRFNPYLSATVEAVCTRPDMMTDLLALYWKDGKKPLRNKLKEGLARAFTNFSEYQLAKYDRDNAVKLRDVMFMCHPKPKTPEQEELFTKVASRTLTTPDTWEVALSSGGDKKETWTRLLSEGKLGATALLRNIRNIQQAEVDRNIIEKALLSMNTDMLVPLDFFKAGNYSIEFSKIIESKMLENFSNKEKLKGKTLLILDLSGSMQQRLSSKSEFSRLDAGIAMTILAMNQCEEFEVVLTAGNDSSYQGAHYHLKYPIKGFDFQKQVISEMKQLGGGGIFTRQCLEWCQEQKLQADRILVFSDSQDCDRYNKTPKPYGKYNYIIDVSAHKNGVNYKNVWTSEISGFSDHFLTYILELENESRNEQEQLN